MKPKWIFPLALVLSLVAAVSSSAAQGPGPQAPLAPQAQVGTAFTYQGQLKSGGSLYGGSCDFQFSLWDAAGSGTPPIGGTQMGTTQTKPNVTVSEGLFTVELSFGADVFTGDARWLQIAVRCPAGSGTYTTLSPRQPVTPAPYALSLRPGASIQGSVAAPNAVISATNTSNSYAGHFVSTHYRGIYVCSEEGWYDGYFAGIGGIYTAGGYWSLASSRTVVVNGGVETLEPGDVVAIAGVSEPLMLGGEPLLAVQKASEAANPAVVGVVVQAMRVQEVERPEEPAGPRSIDVQPVEGSIPPGGYLAIVSHGLMPAVKVTAMAAESLRIGDSVSVGMLGQVQRTEGQYPASAILGKIAGPYDPRTGTVPVFVTLQ